MYPDDYPDYNKLPDVPTCMAEASKATEILFEQLNAVKCVLYSQGMAPDWPSMKWEIPFSDGQLFAEITRMIVQIQQIKFLLIHYGLASEDEMIPLSPRWRIDGHKAHYRNVVIFEQCVRRIIQQEKDGLPEGSFKDIVNTILEQNKDGRIVK